MSAPSILVIGASGRLGIRLIIAASASPHSPSIHAFVRTPSKLNEAEARMCTSIIQGDARKAADVSRALEDSSADVVVLTVGVPNNLGPKDIRYATAKALVEAIRQSGERGQSVKVVVASAYGAGGTTINFGFGLGMLSSYILRHDLKDTNDQERELKLAFERKQEQLLIVRPTALKDGEAEGGVRIFGEGRAPRMSVNRADVAKWIIGEICGERENFGKEVNITGR